ncbi:MAG TPA: LamG-like jellyroll fold domain-containing protein, partial [Polyangiaceae bacterium]|nr:LamG-like jellyroll fold domain-containing protein [Polyangiaceae bacterium]
MARWSCCVATWSLLAAGCPGSVDVDLFDPGTPVLRYDFTGFGTEIRDSIGSAHAHAVGGALLAGTGGLRLDGAGQCIELPSPLVSRFHSATIVAWLEWFGGACWQRVFDFGSSDGAAGWPNNAPMSLFMTPSACSDGSFFAKGQAGTPNFMLRSGSPLPQDRLVQVALSVDGERRRAALFVDGAEVASATVPFALN